MNNRGQICGGVCGGTCPFCNPSTLGDMAKTFWITGTTFVSATVTGISYKFKNIWIPKVKKLFHIGEIHE